MYSKSVLSKEPLGEYSLLDFGFVLIFSISFSWHTSRWYVAARYGDT